MGFRTVTGPIFGRNLGVDLFGAGDRATLRWIGSGTHQGEFLGVPATGKPIEWNAISIYRLANGKITDTWQLIDAWGILRKMGAV
jgi:predicted ester cyclase